MILVEQHIFNKSSSRFKQLDSLCFLSKNLYNYALYTIKQEYELNKVSLNYNALDKLFNHSNQKDYRALPANSSQQTLMLLDTNIKSYFKALKSYKSNPSKFKGLPKFPHYKHKTKGRNPIIFTSQQFKLKGSYIHFPKLANLKPLKTKQSKIQQVRIIPKLNHYVIEVVYKVEDAIMLDNNNKASIDLGVNNLAALTFNNKQESYIINGKPLKSINQYYNKQVAKYKSQLPKKTIQLKGKSKVVQVPTSKKIQSVSHKRNNKVKDYLHKASKDIVNKLQENNISEISIGYNVSWKQSINLGSKTNQSFCSIPHLRFIDNITYKCQLAGIKVRVNEESYTSKCSALDLEKICKHDTYKGKRVKRGLFKTSNGLEINADINGSLNIGRKVFGDDFIKSYQTNRGCGFHPIKVTLK